jgi:hypothetical protein
LKGKRRTYVCLKREGVEKMKDKKETNPATIIRVVIIGVSAVLIAGFIFFLKP